MRITAVALLALAALHVAASETGAGLVDELGCGVCHSGFGDPRLILERAPDLSGLGDRYSNESLFTYLKAPPATGSSIGASRMPDYRLTDFEARALAGYLLGDSGLAPDAVERSEAGSGKRIFEAQRCAACHGGVSGGAFDPAPSLRGEAERVRGDWLRGYLSSPSQIRPLGHPAGSGGRMPDFGLSRIEVDAIAAYLLTAAPAETRPPSLSPYRMHKAQRLLREKLSCLGCHRLGADGGRIGPDLSSLGHRLRADYVSRIVADPLATVPGTVMPHTRLTPANRDLISAFLSQQQVVAAAPQAFDWSASLASASTDRFGAAPYARYCAACHGVDGDGDGPNARFLDPPPTRLSDAARIGDRPDDTLFDAIFVGGRVLDVSQRMPGWGYTLEGAEIRALVAHIRKLCRCEGPPWSRD